ncbi:TolC family outer membrane protein [Ideonella azotifigens]|uniref:Outer membrane channel protein TolC n=1 Tax=Ideonella azotifigens TaxID=513160 RepID=A0ABN1JIA3_9BURK|nr:TolC family outer membrane protein [Ideonella azotifigens]MCD2343523.1 TolC family outer membrane protein [Ideonella azotifigens]
MPRSFRLAAVCLAAWALTTAALPASAADLLAIYQQALAADPTLSAAKAHLGAVQEGVAQAQAPLLPQLAATGSLTHDDAAGQSRGRVQSWGASLNQVLFDGSQFATLQKAQAEAGAEAARLQAAQQALCVRVAQAYFGVLGAVDALANARANQQAFELQVSQSEHRVRQGLIAQLDLDQARAYAGAAVTQTLAAESALEDAREALRQLTGQPVPALQPLVTPLPLALPEPADAQAWVQAALARNPLLAAQAGSLEAAEQAITSARRQHWPTLSAGVDLARTREPGSDAATEHTWALTLKVPLFSGGITQSQVRQAAYQRDEARDGLEALRRQLARDTLAHYRGVVAGAAQVRAAELARDAAERALAATRVGQELGTRTMTDLLLAIQTQTSTQGSYSQLRHQFVLEHLLLKQAGGALSEADLGALNTLLAPLAVASAR